MEPTLIVFEETIDLGPNCDEEFDCRDFDRSSESLDSSRSNESLSSGNSSITTKDQKENLFGDMIQNLQLFIQAMDKLKHVSHETIFLELLKHKNPEKCYNTMEEAIDVAANILVPLVESTENSLEVIHSRANIS